MNCNPFRWVLLGVAFGVLMLYSLAAWSREGAASAELPGDSLYHLDLPMTDQRGHDFRFGDARGKPLVVAMFYTSCRYVCPLIIDTVKAIDHDVSAEQRERYDVLLVSFDPERDDVAALGRVADKRKLEPPHWRLARTDEDHVRELAAALNIQYRRLVDGEFNHASFVTLLDAQGRLVKQTGKLGSSDPEFVAALQSLLQGGAP